MGLFTFPLRRRGLGSGQPEHHLHGAAQVDGSKQLAMGLLLPSDPGIQLGRMCFRKAVAMKLFGTISLHALTSKPKSTISLIPVSVLQSPGEARADWGARSLYLGPEYGGV
jgi:hypothetical protein